MCQYQGHFGYCGRVAQVCWQNRVPKGACVFVHLHQVLILEDMTCVVVNDGANEVNGGVRGLGDCFQEDAFNRKCVSAMN